MRQARLFDAFDTATTRGVVDDLLGDDQWTSTAGWGQALLSFPQGDDWAVNHSGWHLDLPAKGDPEAVDVARMFGFVVEVVPAGGGTLVVEGSDPLLRKMLRRSTHGTVGSSRQVRRRLGGRHPWFERLLTAPRDGADAAERDAELLEGAAVDGIPVRVRELTGDPGDVVVMLPWTMHAISRHCGDRARIVANHTTFRQGVTGLDGGP